MHVRSVCAAVFLAILGVAASFAIPGCTNDGKGIPGAKAGKQSSDADRIKAQAECPVSEKKLGSMGDPVKVMVNGEPVFLCCESCREDALANAEKTLSKVGELLAKNKK